MTSSKPIVYHICDDGTIIEKKDYDWLQLHMKKQTNSPKYKVKDKLSKRTKR
jgi:hypothetical protein